MDASFFEGNRKAVLGRMQQGDVLLLFAGKAPNKRGDEDYPFTPDRNFYYLTGIDRQHMILLLEKTAGGSRTRLYIPPDNGQQARWVGANLTPQEATALSGITDVAFLSDWEQDRQGLTAGRLWLDQSRVDLPDWAISLGFAEFTVEDAAPMFAQLRTTKQPQELEKMKQAMAITAEAITEMMKNAKPGMMEYELEAYYDFVLRKRGVKDKAFTTIVAAGQNGTVLHYSQNDGCAQDGDLVLVDAGAQVGYYNGDITRTFPVNGKFTPRQRQVYDIVLGGQALILSMIRPGVAYPSLNEALKEYYYEALKKIGLVQTREEVFQYYFHNVSHYLGAETHDVGDRKGILQEGMVITVEPGLYIAPWRIGIRIEDDVLVTKDGAEVLTGAVVKDPDAIEALMAHKQS